jgi:hypothetical protein
MSTRTLCLGCGKTRKLYCYSPECLSALSPSSLPVLSLPIRLAVAHHREELLAKSTALHAKVLAPLDVDFYYDDRVSQVPLFSAEDTLALFPSPGAVTCRELGREGLARFTRVVVVEGTWVKARAAVKRARVEHLVHVKLSDYQTMFWREQFRGRDRDKTRLSSIEAIYYFYKEYLEVMEGEYDGRLDELLCIFLGMKQRVDEAKKCTNE